MPILSPAQPLRRGVRVFIHPARTNGRPLSRGSTCRRRNRTAYFYTPAALGGDNKINEIENEIIYSVQPVEEYEVADNKILID